MESELNQSVANLALEHPSWIPCFESLRIDYCCQGMATLADACRAKGLEPEATLAELHRHDTDTSVCHMDVARLDVGELVDHIVGVHHVYLRKQLPVLHEQLERVRQKHGHRHPKLAEISAHFQSLREELEHHMLKEELVLFPWAKRPVEPSPAFNISMPIQCMEREHEFAGRTLEKLRSLSNDYTAPLGACTTYTMVMNGLADLERDLHQHIHEENNILFPRLLKGMEGRLASPSCAHRMEN